jgi:hypothetical protein
MPYRSTALFMGRQVRRQAWRTRRCSATTVLGQCAMPRQYCAERASGDLSAGASRATAAQLASRVGTLHHPCRIHEQEQSGWPLGGRIGGSRRDLADQVTRHCTGHKHGERGRFYLDPHWRL